MNKLLVALGGIRCDDPSNIITLSGTDFFFSKDNESKGNKILGVALKGSVLKKTRNSSIFKKENISCNKHITNKASRTPQTAPLL